MEIPSTNKVILSYPNLTFGLYFKSDPIESNSLFVSDFIATMTMLIFPISSGCLFHNIANFVI